MKRVISAFCFFIIISFQSVFSQESDKEKNFFSLPLEDLMNITVNTAGKKAQTLNEVPASVVVITRKEIERYGYQTLDELLSHILGVFVHDSFHPMGKVSVGVRGYTTSGGGNDNIIILVNGVNQIEGVYNQYLLPKIALAVELIDRIEVIRGPMSVLYGSGAFYGAINIITDEMPKNSENFIQGSLGSYKGNKLVLKAATGGEKYKIVFNASRYSTDGIDKPYSDMMSNPGTLWLYGLPADATTGSMLKDERTYFNLSGNYSDFKIDIGHTEYEKGALLNSPSVDYSAIRMLSTNVMAYYKNRLSNIITLEGKISYLSSASLAFYTLNEKESFISFGYNSNAYEFEVNTFINPAVSLSLTLGLMHRNVYYATNPFEGEAAWGPAVARSITRLTEGSSIKTNALFLQGEYDIGEAVKLVGGLRLEQIMNFEYEASSGAPTLTQGRQVLRDTYDNNKIRLIPRLAFIYKPHKDHVIKFLYGEALRHPPLGQLSDNLIKFNPELVIPKLNPARINTFELNYLMNYKSLFSLNFSLFRNELIDLFSRKNFTLSTGGTGLYITNEGHLVTYGIELGINLHPLAKLELNLSASYQKSENRQEGYTEMNVAQSPRLLGYLKGAYFIDENITIALTGNYVDEMEADYNINKIRYGEKVPSYFVLNCNIRMNNFLYEGIYFAAHCSNIFDSQIHYPVYSTSAFADKGVLAPGRGFLVTLGYSF